MGKFIIYLLIFLGWRFFKFYKKSLEEQKKNPTKAKPSRQKSSDPFKNLQDMVEKWEKATSEKTSTEWKVEEVFEEPDYNEPIYDEAVVEEEPIDTAKGWKFGESELNAAKAAHKRHATEFVPSKMEEEDTIADGIVEDFDMRTAVVYSEILNRPYKD